jgi:hypothetical protein
MQLQVPGITRAIRGKFLLECERQDQKMKLESKSSTTKTTHMLSMVRVVTPTLVYMAAASISDLGTRRRDAG